MFAWAPFGVSPYFWRPKQNYLKRFKQDLENIIEDSSVYLIKLRGDNEFFNKNGHGFGNSLCATHNTVNNAFATIL